MLQMVQSVMRAQSQVSSATQVLSFSDWHFPVLVLGVDYQIRTSLCVRKKEVSSVPEGTAVEDAIGALLLQLARAMTVGAR